MGWCAVLALSPTLTLTCICCGEQAPSDYLIQRPSDGVIIFGSQRKSVPVERLLGNTDDAQVDPEMAAALREALPRYFEGWGENSDLAVGEGLVHVWSGEFFPTSRAPRI
jgi:hypothetical protein